VCVKNRRMSSRTGPSSSSSTRKPIKLFVKNQITNQRTCLGDFPNPGRTTVAEAMSKDPQVLNWVSECNFCCSVVYLRSKTRYDKWDKTLLTKLLGQGCSGSYILTFNLEQRSSPPDVGGGGSNALVDSSPKQTSISLQSALQMILTAKEGQAASNACISTLLKYVNGLLKYNTIDNERYEKVRKINTANATFVSKVSNVNGGIEFLIALGFTRSEDGSLDILPQNESQHWILHGKSLLQEASTPIETKDNISSSISSAPVATYRDNTQENETLRNSTPEISMNGFDPYQSHNFNSSFAATGGKINPSRVIPSAKYESKIEKDLRKLEERAEKFEAKNTTKSLDRKIVAIRPGDIESVTDVSKMMAEDDLGRKSDGKLFMQRIQHQQEQSRKLENTGFTTKAMRDLEKMKKAKVYSHTNLRISFSNGHSLSCRFLPSETINVVKSIIIESLVDEYAKEPFDLYVTPPRTVMQINHTLAEAQLVPAAKLHVSWKSRNADLKGNCIKEELYSRKTENTFSYPKSRKVAEERSSDDSRSKREDDLVARMMGNSKSIGKKAASSSKIDSKPKPKWFK